MTEQIQLSKREIYRRWRIYKRTFRKGLRYHFASKREFWSYNVAKRSEYFDVARKMMSEIERSI